MFITTANSLRMAQPLMDRMEIIRLAGYTEDEKVAISRKHLIPKQIEANGLREGELDIQDERCATSCATTRARRVSVTSSARSPTSAARASRRSS